MYTYIHGDRDFIRLYSYREISAEGNSFIYQRQTSFLVFVLFRHNNFKSVPGLIQRFLELIILFDKIIL